MDAALNVNGEGTMAWDLHRRMGYLAAGLHCRCQGRFDIVHQPVGPHYRLLGLVHGRPHSHQSTFRQCGRACVAEPGVRLNATFAASVPKQGNVAFISQSGALGEAILADAAAIGIGVSIFWYAIINIMVATRLFPVTGLPLPFVSYGGSSLVSHLVALGVLRNIARQVEQPARERRRWARRYGPLVEGGL